MNYSKHILHFLNKEQLRVFESGLETVRKYAINKDKRLDTSNGICYNLDKSVRDDVDFSAYRFMTIASIGWEHHSGDPEYPIPSMYFAQLWEGNQLELRIQLIDYILDNLKEIL